jgi:hypothetical protein
MIADLGNYQIGFDVYVTESLNYFVLKMSEGLSSFDLNRDN